MLGEQVEPVTTSIERAFRSVQSTLYALLSLSLIRTCEMAGFIFHILQTRKPNLRRAACLSKVTPLERVELGFEVRSSACQGRCLISCRGREGVRKFHLLAVSISCQPTPAPVYAPGHWGTEKVVLGLPFSPCEFPRPAAGNCCRMLPLQARFCSPTMAPCPCSSVNSLTGILKWYSCSM